MSKVLVLKVSAGRFTPERGGEPVDMSEAVVVESFEPFQLVTAGGDGARGCETQIVYLNYADARRLLLDENAPPVVVEGRILALKSTKDGNRTLLQITGVHSRVDAKKFEAVLHEVTGKSAGVK